MQHDDIQGKQLGDVPDRSEAEQQAFHDAALNCALEAEAKVGIVEHHLLVAGVRVRLCFAGSLLEREFMGALRHLVVPAMAEVDAVFHVWDSDSTGVEMVPPPCPSSCFTYRGDLWGFNSRRIRSAFHCSEYSVCLFDTETRVGTYWISSTEGLPYWAKSSPLRTHFHWLMNLYGKQLVHGAAIGTAEGGVLITGKGGVGKSTTSLSSLSAGLQFASDDYVIVGTDPPAAYSLYCTAKVNPRQLQAFPALESLSAGMSPEDEKAVLYLYPDHQERLAPMLPLRWLLTPRFGDSDETRFEPVATAELHQAAAFTTTSQLPHAGEQTHAIIAELIRKLPNARLVLGRDVHAVPQALIRLMETGAAMQDRVQGEQPLVSVIIPVYNGSRFLPEAVACIMGQGYPAVEIVVVDDGSPDDVEAIVASLPVAVKYIRQKNAGPAAARNRGIREASGSVLAFLDVDDLWPENNLPVMVSSLLGSRGAEVAIGRAQMARSNAGVDTGIEFIGNPMESYPYYIGAAIYRREVFDKVGLFDETLRYGEDTDWFCRLQESGLGLERLEQMSAIIRRHDDNMTNGKTVVELNVAKAIKKALDRRRARET